MKKYYFITYQAASKSGGISKWNQVIKESPMEFIKSNENDKHYRDFVVINTLEITEEEYNYWNYKF